MAEFDLRRRMAAEGLGTAFLVAAVVGSGIMAETLTRDPALQLLCNTLSTGAVLVVLISMLAPISGAHFNPAVSLVFAARGELPSSETVFYIASQAAGGVAGTMIAHLMFSRPVFELSTKLRMGGGQWFAEAVATFGLVAAIFGGIRFQKPAIPWLVGLYITSAYWFTASTSFANPAVTLARALTDSFSGIAPISVPFFIAAQAAGALLAGLLAGWLFAPPSAKPEAAGPRPAVKAEFRASRIP
jgi:glycerol uptake facilitator-like aquaporin